MFGISLSEIEIFSPDYKKEATHFAREVFLLFSSSNNVFGNEFCCLIFDNIYHKTLSTSLVLFHVTHLTITLAIRFSTTAGTIHITTLGVGSLHRAQTQAAVGEPVEPEQAALTLGTIIVWLTGTLSCERVTVVV